MMAQGFKEPEKNFFNTRRRTLLHLIHKFLNESGYADIAAMLKQEALLNEYEICDNIDIDIIFLEYCSYQQLKFGKIPNILKKIPLEKFHLSETKGKKSVRNTQKKTAEITETMSHEDGLRETLAIKQIENQNLNKLMNPAAILTSNYELSGDFKEFSDLIIRTLLKRDSKCSFDNVIGNDEAILTIKEAVLLPLENPHLFEGDLKPWKSVLLYGPPGCGKTLIAKALCSQIQDNLPFFNITSSTIISKWRGDSEKILNAIFQMARNLAPSVIFFDEIECLTSRRNSANEHEASHRLKSEFLTLLDGIHDTSDNVFLLANTNVPWSIDDAFLRRFEKKILIQLPNADERLKIFNYYLDESKMWSQQSMDEIKRLSDGFTGDEIRIACKEAKMKSLRNVMMIANNGKNKIGDCFDVKASNRINPEILIEAIKSIKPNSNKLFDKHLKWQEELNVVENKNN